MKKCFIFFIKVDDYKNRGLEMDMKRLRPGLVIYWNFVSELEEPPEHGAVPDSSFSEGIKISKKVRHISLKLETCNGP